MEETHFTEQEFKDIRSKIEEIFKDDFYKVSKSSYEWSQSHDWRVNVKLSMNWRNNRYESPDSKIEAVADLFKKVYKFVQDDEHHMKLVNVISRSDFGYEFIFQPVVIVALKLLANLVP
jgi:hypothetical protein